MFNPYNSYSWTSCLFSTLNTIKKIPNDIQYTYDCKLKKIREMLLTTLEHNQHDVIWRLPVWNVKIRRYLASCTLEVWYNLTKISIQGKLFNYFRVFVVNMTCMISHFQDGRSFQQNHLVSLLVDLYAWNDLGKT